MRAVKRLIWAVCLTFGTARPMPAEPPDLIVYNAKVVTVDAKFNVAQAFAVHRGRIVAVGDNEAIRGRAGPTTVVVDRAGKTVLPGLCDSHVHPVGAALYEFDHAIPEMATIGDVLAYIRHRAEILPAGAWIQLRQVFITRLREQRYPTRAELDAAAPRNPVVFSTGPDAVLNSLALKESGIDRDFKITDGQAGQIEMDPKTGEPNGVLRNCGRLVKAKSSEKQGSKTERLDRLKKLFADYNQVGITSLSDRNATDDAIELYQQLRANQQLTCRIFLSYALNAQASLADVEKAVARATSHPLHVENDWLWLRGTKIFLDGGMLTGSAYMLQPWGISEIYSITDPNYRGLLFVERTKLVQLVEKVLANGLQFTAHSVGDGAVHALIDAYEEVNKRLPIREKRPCITHCNFLSAGAIDRMARLGIVADLQPAWLWLDGATLRKQFGENRLAYFQPYRTLADKGVFVGGGSDHMQRIGSFRSVNPYNPFLGMWITLKRLPRWTDATLHVEQRITREEAIRLYTTNNAWITFNEKRTGAIAPGMLADFIFLDRDILTCDEDAIPKIQVEATYIEGRRVHP